MKIWLLTNEYPPFFGGGMATYVKAAAEMLAAAGQDVTVFIQDDHAESIENIQGIRIVRFLIKIKEGYDYPQQLALQMSETVVKQITADGAPPDIIEVQDCLGLGYYLLKGKAYGEPLLKNIPIVVIMHTPMFEVGRANLWNMYTVHISNFMMKFREKECLTMADGLLCPSNFLKKQIRLTMPELDITVMPLPLPDLSYEKNADNPAKGKIDLLFFGRLEYRKGIAQFIEVAARRWAEGRKFNITVIGKDMLFVPEKCFMGAKLQQKYQEYAEDGRLTFIEQLAPAELYMKMRMPK